ENSRRATYVHQQYAIQNPHGWAGYGEHCWGITASDGPGPTVQQIDGVERTFNDYQARGAPDGPDDGSIAPWAVVCSLPFAPEIVLPTIEYFEHLQLRVDNPYGFKATYNPTFKFKTPRRNGWISPYHFGLDQGPIVLMIANDQSGLLWELLRKCPYLVTGLRRAGFTGGWLDHASRAPSDETVMTRAF
ncbi:MAG TPA: glucoamylase family protein, partial [Chloroflexota bacterium]|nr:glucoamylase family protein [Chloroflexota bacterium]